MIKKYSIKVNGNTYEVEVEELGTLDNKSYKKDTTSNNIVQPVVQKQSSPQVDKKTLGGSLQVNAPMPGTICDVKVKSGDNVKKGQVLLILEAMKMENEIMAESDGRVESVNVSKGASVSVGDVLIKLA